METENAGDEMRNFCAKDIFPIEYNATYCMICNKGVYDGGGSASGNLWDGNLWEHAKLHGKPDDQRNNKDCHNSWRNKACGHWHIYIKTRVIR